MFDPTSASQKPAVAEAEEGFPQPANGAQEELEAEPSSAVKADQPSAAAAGTSSRPASSTGERPKSAGFPKPKPGLGDTISTNEVHESSCCLPH